MDFMRYWLERLGIFGNVVGQAACSKSTSLLSASRRASRAASRSDLRTTQPRPAVEELEDRNVPTTIITGTGTGLTGAYYDNQTLTGSATLYRIDPTIDFNWSTKSPASSLPDQHFSVKWTGVIEAPETGTYTFSTTSDDGIRLIVNEKVLINNWTTHSATTNTATITLTAGQKYSIEVDYFQNTGSAVAELAWTRPDGVKQIIPTSQLYARDTTPPTATLSSAKSITTPGKSPYTFQVTYTDDVDVYYYSLHTGNLVVTGPNGFKQTATLVSVSQSSDGPSLVATYQITPPGGSWAAADAGTYTVTLEASQVRDTSGNFIASKTLGTFSVVLAGDDWYSDHFTETNFASEVRTLDAGRSWSRSDMLTLFQWVESNGTVTSAELNDLKSLVANSSYLGMPYYVEDLANKVINGDPANATYLGHSLGNLKAGSSAAQLTDLEDMWFLGTDLPTIASGLHYQQASGTLFGSGGPKLTDIVQGEVDDCYFLAGLGETALHSPSTIENMFINNGDGTYTLKFLNNGTPDYVTVNLELPATSNGTFAYANVGASLSSPSNVLWVALAEKGYAELAASGWTRGAGQANAYSSINLGWEGDVVNQVAGKNETVVPIANNSTTLEALITAEQDGKWVGLESDPRTAANIVSNHVYVLESYNTSTHLFTLYNPWGSTIPLSWAQIETNFNGWSENVS